MSDELDNLFQQLQTSDDQTRLEILDAIGQSGDVRAYGLLVGVALFNERAYVRYDALLVLEKLHGHGYLGLFMSIIEDPDEGTAIRCRAIKAIGRLGDESCIPLLQDLCQSEESIIAETAAAALDSLQK